MLSLRCNILISIHNHMIRPLKFLSLFLDHLNIFLIVLSTHLSDELLRMHTKMSDCSTSWEHRRRRSSSCCGNKNNGFSVRCTTVQLYIFSASSRWGKRQEPLPEGKPSLVMHSTWVCACWAGKAICRCCSHTIEGMSEGAFHLYRGCEAVVQSS